MYSMKRFIRIREITRFDEQVETITFVFEIHDKTHGA